MALGISTQSEGSGPELTSSSTVWPRLLIVEDDAATNLAIAKLAESIGYVTKGASSIEEADRLLRTERYDCITLDLTLGRDSGVQLVSALAARAPDAPIIFVSGSPAWIRSMASSVARVARLNVVEVITKPIDFAKLRAALTAAKGKSPDGFPARQPISDLNAPSTNNNSVEKPSRSAGRLLVIDDDLSIRLLITSFAERAGFTVTPAASFAEAKQLLLADYFDGITLDLNIEKESGIGILRVLADRKSEAPVIIISGSAPSASDLAAAVGNMMHLKLLPPLPKPIDFGRLKAALHSIRQHAERPAAASVT